MMSRGIMVSGYLRMSEAWKAFAGTFLPPSGFSSRLPHPERRTEPLTVLDGRFASARGNTYPVMDRVFSAFGHTRVEVEGDEVYIGGKGPYREVAPYELAMEGEDVRFAFRVNQGAVVLNSSNGFPGAPLLKQPWHYNGVVNFLPMIVAIFLGLPAGLYAAFQKKNQGARQVAGFGFVAAAGLLIGLLLEFQYFPSEYFPAGATFALLLWRLLIHIGWAAAVFGLVLTVGRRREVFNIDGIGAGIRSLFMAALTIGFVSIVVLVPYWGLLFNFTH
jgi:hypothetical protein